MKKLCLVVAIALSFFLMLDTNQAQAYSYGFYRITDNGNTNVSSQLSMDVLAVGTTQVSFTFYNNVGTPSSITGIYFDDGSLLGIASISDSGDGVAFKSPAPPEVLPGGNLVSPHFVTTAGFSADSTAPVMANGVNSSTEWVEILFNLQTGKTFAGVISDLSDGDLRVGLHVQSIGTTGGSDSYVNVVPIPAAAWLLGTGLLGLVAIRRRVSK